MGNETNVDILNNIVNVWHVIFQHTVPVFT